MDGLRLGAAFQWGIMRARFNNASPGLNADGQSPRNNDIDATLIASDYFVPGFKKQGGGAIINVASAASYTAAPEMSAYNVTKAGVLALSETLSAELKKDNIRVNALCPGFIAGTGLTGPLAGTLIEERWKQAVPMGRGGTAEEMARVAAFLASDDASYVTGANLVADGGVTAHTGQPSILDALREAGGQ